eukprot:scaffold110962_cov17-Tisochrysis_lutea.AAC.1
MACWCWPAGKAPADTRRLKSHSGMVIQNVPRLRRGGGCCCPPATEESLRLVLSLRQVLAPHVSSSSS